MTVNRIAFCRRLSASAGVEQHCSSSAAPGQRRLVDLRSRDAARSASVGVLARRASRSASPRTSHELAERLVGDGAARDGVNRAPQRRSSPGSACCSRRAATFERVAGGHGGAAERIANHHLARLDADTRLDSDAVASGASLEMDCQPSRIANAALTARSGSSSWACGKPKTAITASPLNFSTVPPRASISRVASSKILATSPRTTSGSSLRQSGGAPPGPRTGR